MRLDFRDGERVRSVEIEFEGAGAWRVSVDGAAYSVQAEALEGGRLRLVTPDGVTTAEVTAAGTQRFVRLGNMDFVLERLAGARRRAGGPAGGGMEAPMPGVVTRVMVAAGAEVKKGQPLVAIEAMKMEHVVRAPRDGTVATVTAQVGEMVASGVALVTLEEE